MALQGSFEEPPLLLVRVLAGNIVTSTVVFACLNTTDATVLRRLHPAVAAAVAGVPWPTTTTAVSDTTRWRAALPAAVGLKLAAGALDAAFVLPSGVTSLVLSQCYETATDAVIARLPPTLRSLHVSYAWPEYLTAQCSFAHLSALEWLDCSDTHVLEAELDRLPPSLRELHMHNCNLPATADFSHLHALLVVVCADSHLSSATVASLPPSLEVLDISDEWADGKGRFPPTGWSFAHLTRLHDLRASSSRIDAAALATLPPSVRTLELCNCRFSAAASFAHLTRLHTLNAKDTCLRDATLATLPPSLVSLDLHIAYRHTLLTPAAVFPHLPALLALDVSGTPIGNAAVASMPPGLVHLRMTHCDNITQRATLDHLTALRELRSVGTDLSPATVAACRARGCAAPFDGVVYKDGTCQYTVHRYRYSLVQLPDGRLVSSAPDGLVALLAPSAHGWSVVAKVVVPAGAVAVTFAVLPDGHRVAIGTHGYSGGGIAVWDASNPLGGTKQADGRRRIDVTIKLPDRSYPTALTALRDGQLVAGCADGCLRIVDGDARTVLATLAGHTYGVTALVTLPEGTVASTASGDKTVRLWNMDTRTCTAVLEGHTEGVTSLAVLPDGRLASGSWDYTVRLWDVSSNTCVRVFDGHKRGIIALAVLPGGQLVVAGLHDDNVWVWDTRHVSGTTTPLVAVVHVGCILGDIVPLPGGRLAIGGLGVRLWQLPAAVLAT